MRLHLRTIVLALSAPLWTVGAQTTSALPTESNWAAWLGCWTPTDAAGPMLTTCAIPGDDAQTVRVVRIVAGRIVQRRTITADGVVRASTLDGCVGTESATFSADGQRVFLKGESKCSGGPVQQTSAVMSIAGNGDWVEVLGTRVGDQRDVRVARASFRDDLGVLPPETRAQLEPWVPGARAGNIAARVPLGTDLLVEASAALDVRVAEAWLVETSAGEESLRPATAADLVRLADGGVADRVIDLYVALGYPKRFAVGPQAGLEGDQERETRMPIYGYSGYSPQCFYDYTYECYGFGSRIEWYRDAYARWGGYAGRYAPGTQVFVVPPRAAGGRVVKGRGYTKPTPASGEPATPRSTQAGSNGGSSSGSSAPAQAPAPRTAKPRNP